MPFVGTRWPIISPVALAILEIFMNYSDIREECCDANKRLPKTGLVDLTFGNVSVLDEKAGVFAIKPSGVPYDILTPAQIVVVDLEGKIVDGKLNPSSDVATHRLLLKKFKGIRSVVHTHSRTAVSFAQAGLDIPCLGTTHADYFNGPVPVTRSLTAAEIARHYEEETANVIIERFKRINPLEIPAVLVRNHGPFAWAKSGAKAVETAQALEIVAEMAWKALTLNPRSKEISPALLKKHFFRKHGTKATYGQSGSH